MGSFGRSEILAWSVATSTRYAFGDLPLSPLLEVKANAISGDGKRNDHRLGTFNALFPRGKYFGEIGLIGPYNLLNVHPTVGVSLGSGWSLSGAAVFYWREALEDGVYGNPGNLLRSAGSSRARCIGTQAEVVLGWEATRNISLEAAYAVFAPGRFIVETGPSRPCISSAPRCRSGSETDPPGTNPISDPCVIPRRLQVLTPAIQSRELSNDLVCQYVRRVPDDLRTLLPFSRMQKSFVRTTPSGHARQPSTLIVSGTNASPRRAGQKDWRLRTTAQLC